jgi:hypothetical protein
MTVGAGVAVQDGSLAALGRRILMELATADDAETNF